MNTLLIITYQCWRYALYLLQNRLVATIGDSSY